MDNTEDFFKNYRGRYSQYWIERWGLIPELPTSFDNANSVYELVAWLQRAFKNLLDDFQQLEGEFEDFKNAIIELLEYLIPELIRRYHDSAEFRAIFISLLEDILAGEERTWVKDLLKELIEVDMREWIEAYLKELLTDLELQEFFEELFKVLLNNLQNQVNTNKTDITITNSRIDNLIATAGDGTIPSELTDMRLGFDGKTDATAGEAVRRQFQELSRKAFTMFQLQKKDFMPRSVNTGAGRLAFSDYSVYYGNTAVKKINRDMQLYKNISGYRTIIYYFKQDLSFISSETVGDTVKTGIYIPNIPLDAHYFALSIGELEWDIEVSSVLENINIFSHLDLEDISYTPKAERFDYSSINPLIAPTTFTATNTWYTLTNSDTWEITTTKLISIRVVWAINGQNIRYEGYLNSEQNPKIEITKPTIPCDVYLSISNQDSSLVLLKDIAEMIGYDKFYNYNNIKLINQDFSLANVTDGRFTYKYVDHPKRKSIAKPVFIKEGESYKLVSKPNTYVVGLNGFEVYLSNTNIETTHYIAGFKGSGFILIRAEDEFFLTKERRESRDMPQILGHRCFMNEAPENTIEAMKKAKDNGYNAVEIDVQKSADGVYVVHHDQTLLRMCGIDRKISEMTVAEIQSYPLTNGNNLAEFDDVRVPTLKQFLKASKLLNVKVFMDNSQTYPFEEIKSAIAGYDVIPRLSGYNSSVNYDGVVWFVGNALNGEAISSRYPINLFTSYADETVKAEIQRLKSAGLKVAYFLDAGQESQISDILSVGFDIIETNSYGKNLIL